MWLPSIFFFNPMLPSKFGKNDEKEINNGDAGGVVVEF